VVSPVASSIDRLAGHLTAGARVTVLTGAGVSAASGVPTFRGPDGLWKQYRPEQLATPEAFARDPRLVWEWYDWRRQRIAACCPNGAHQVLAGWRERYPGFTLITQNVDGLHERAGTRHVLRIHGSIWEVSCWSRCAGSRPRWPDETVPLREIPPRCSHCSSLIRPGVVWFGEAIDPEIMKRCLEATPASSFVDVALHGPAETILAEIEARLRRRG